MMDSMDAEIIIDDSLDNAIVNDGIIQDSIVDEGTISDSIDAEEVKLISLVYSGAITDSIEVFVNNENKKIYASLNPIQYPSKESFPEVGSDKLLYIDLSNTSIWFYDTTTATYKEAVNTEGLATEDFVNNLLKDYATKDFVEKNGGKIDTISINNAPQQIVNKNVNIDLSSYSTNENVNSVKQELQGNIDKSNELIDSVAKDLSDIAQDVGEDIDNINKQFNDYAKLKASQTFTGSQTIVGNLTIEGNITQNGENYITQAEKVETEDDYIVMRKGATGGLGGGYSGFEIKNYNGNNEDVRLVVDSEGTARVGDIGDEQPLLTREESEDLTDGEVLVWNATTNRAEGSSGFAKTTDLDGYVKNIEKTRIIYGTDDSKKNISYWLDYSNTAQVNRIPFRADNGAIMITDKSCVDGGSGAIPDGLQAVNKNFVKNNFVKQEEGKGLSSNDFTQAYINKIAELENSFPTVTRLV